MPRPERGRRFLIDPREFLNDPAVLRMNPAELGAYVALWLNSWDMPTPGVIPADERLLASLSRTGAEWPFVREAVACAFDCQSQQGYWVQRGTVRTHEAQQRTFNRRSKIGQDAANARYNKPITAEGMPEALPDACRIGVGVGVGSGESKTPTTPPAQSARAAKPRSARVPATGSIGLPTNTNGEWHPTQEELDAWELAYPAIDLPSTLLEMRAWLVANPTRKKTLDGMPRFVNRWLAKEQNSA